MQKQQFYKGDIIHYDENMHGINHKLLWNIPISIVLVDTEMEDNRKYIVFRPFKNKIRHLLYKIQQWTFSKK